MSAEDSSLLTAKILTVVAERSVHDAVQLLGERNLDNVETILALAALALNGAETEPELSAHWLEICKVCNQSIGSDSLEAQIAYTQARLDLQQGDLSAAEQNIVKAQTAWQKSGDSASIARSNLGLTQILAMQGRYADAETSIRQAIDYFEKTLGGARNSPNPDDYSATFRLIGARRNLANLYSYQDRHQAALAEFAKVNDTIDQIQTQLATDSEDYNAFQYERAHVAISSSLSFSHLDQISEAEATLFAALAIFEQDGGSAQRGQVYSNLGSLYLRMGRYSDALAAFEQSSKHLIGDELISDNLIDDNADVDKQKLFGASSMLLEQSTAHIALNLLPEAESSLLRCESIFRHSGVPPDAKTEYAMPHELGRTLFALGQVYVRQGNLTQANSAVSEAKAIFESIDNLYWLNQCQLAMATVADLQGDQNSSITLLDKLIAVSERDDRTDADTNTDTDADSGATALDLTLLTDARLLRLRIHVDRGEVDLAQGLASQVEASIASATEFRHLHLRLVHAQALIAQAVGDYAKARILFLQAIDLLERQRSTLLIEEVRSAFVIDKTDIYTDLVLNILSIIDAHVLEESVGDIDSKAESEADKDESLIAEAFSVIERARSRTLLERLLAALPSDSGSFPDDSLQEDSFPEGSLQEGREKNERQDDDETLSQQRSQREILRRELHWLYNRLLGQDGVRRTDVALTEQIQSCEDKLQRLERQVSPVLQQADPVELDSLQKALAADQQAVAYYIAHDEVMAFVVSQTEVKFQRQVCSKHDLLAALRDFRFQLGRFQVGHDYVERHAARLHRGIDSCLNSLYQLLIGPLADHLTADRLLIIPFGIAHLVPFHALLHENSYLIERFECSYAPSASIAVTCQQYASHQAESEQAEFSSLAALGITDELIPEARIEVEQIAQHFDTAYSYLDERANHENLTLAASQADILHIATHGLYRSDNPFFSSLKLADGWIDIREIYRLPLRARLVVLSACESGSGYVQDGDEVIGLARGFLGAGAHALVVSMWNLHDATAAQQMNCFYDALKNHDDCRRPASALRKAQIESISQGQHPYYWAPFAVIG